MKNLRYWAIYLILWIAALSLAVINIETGNHAAWQQWAIAQAILCGLMVGETRNTDPREMHPVSVLPAKNFLGYSVVRAITCLRTMFPVLQPAPVFSQEKA